MAQEEQTVVEHADSTKAGTILPEVIGVLIAAATVGAAAYAAGPAMAAAGGAIGAVSGATVTGLSSTAMAAVSLAAQGLVGAGMTAGSALVVGGVLVGGTVGAATGAGAVALRDIFLKHNSSVSKAGCYAGPDWTFRTKVTPYRGRWPDLQGCGGRVQGPSRARRPAAAHRTVGREDAGPALTAAPSGRRAWGRRRAHRVNPGRRSGII